MGIKDLFTVIKSKCPEQIQDFHLSEWNGRSFAVDISIFLNKFVKSAGEHLWMNSFFLFLCTLKKHRIKAVCIFDGPNPPPEKKAEQESRKAGSEKAKTRLKRATELRDIITQKYISNNSQLPQSLIDECKIIIGSKRDQRIIYWDEPTDIYDALKEVIGRLERQTSPITNEQREKAWKIVKMMGLPVFQYDGEAEALCAYLAIHEHVDAVLTEDTDVLAYGTPWMVAFKEYKLSEERIKGVNMETLLDALEYNLDEFKDLCILLSCDYNDRVKGFPKSKTGQIPKKSKCIGWVGAVSMVDEYRRLEIIEEHLEDASPLIYPRCRELFKSITYGELETIIQLKPYANKPNFEEIDIFLTNEKLSISVDYIKRCWEPVPIVFCDDSFSSDEDENEIKTLDFEPIADEESSYFALLAAECMNEESESKVISLHTMFCNKLTFDMANDEGFDQYIEIISDWIQELNPGFYVDDYIECEDCSYEKPKNVKILEMPVF
jgi:5'-3' exonuclease